MCIFACFAHSDDADYQNIEPEQKVINENVISKAAVDAELCSLMYGTDLWLQINLLLQRKKLLLLAMK